MHFGFSNIWSNMHRFCATTIWQPKISNKTTCISIVKGPLTMILILKDDESNKHLEAWDRRHLCLKSIAVLLTFTWIINHSHDALLLGSSKNWDQDMFTEQKDDLRIWIKILYFPVLASEWMNHLREWLWRILRFTPETFLVLYKISE